jgi:periplasmic protein TonB
MALLVEAAMVGGAAVYLERAAPVLAPRLPEPIKVEMTALPTPEAPKPPEPQSPPPEPPKVPTPKPVHAKPVARPQPAAEKPAAPPMPVPAEQPSDAPSSFATATVPPPPPPAPSSSANTATATDLFQAALRAAVQAAVRYPSAARILKLTGQTKLGFDYQDGRITSPHIVRSCGRAMLDQAALEALQNAVFPAPPKELVGHLMKLEITVIFSL